MTDSPNDDAQSEIAELDSQIAEVVASIDDVRSQLASAGALEEEERAAVLNNLEELEGILDGLRGRRAALGEDGHAS